MENACTLVANASVTLSTQLGTTGNSGTPAGGGVYGYHLHQDVRKNGAAGVYTNADTCYPKIFRP